MLAKYLPALGCNRRWGPAHLLLILTPVLSLNEHCSRWNFFKELLRSKWICCCET